MLTAHPTEIMRRTLQYKYGRTADALAGLDRGDATPLEREALVDALKREIQAAWETEDVRRERPSPLEEVRAALTIFDQVLWNAVPEFLRSLDRTLRRVTHRDLPLGVSPIRFGSWIGGDRDGNPSVTSDVTRRACLVARRAAAMLYLQEIDQLHGELSLSDGTEDLRARAAHAPEPYRAILHDVRARLHLTRDWLEACLAGRMAIWSARPAPTSTLTSSPSRFVSAIDRCTPPETASLPTADCSTCCAAWRPSVSRSCDLTFARRPTVIRRLSAPSRGSGGWVRIPTGRKRIASPSSFARWMAGTCPFLTI